MSALLHYLTPSPASVPIVTAGNAFWRGAERFLIKGISYHAYRPETSEEKRELPHGPGPHIDPLTQDRLVELEKDIPLIRW